MSPFMVDQLKFRADPLKLDELLVHPKADTGRERFRFPRNILTSFGLFTTGFIFYTKSRGQGVAHELVKSRQFSYRMRKSVLAMTSMAFILAGIFNSVGGPERYFPSEP